MIDWMSDYWWLSLIALVIGLGTAYWMWCVECPDDVRDRALDRAPDVKTEPPKPLEPKKPEIAAARPMNFKDAPGFDTGKAAAGAAAVGAAGLAAAAVAKASDPVEAPKPKAAPPPPAPKPAPVAKVETPKPAAPKAAAPKAVKAAPVKVAAAKAAPKPKAEAKPKAAAKPAVKVATKAATKAPAKTAAVAAKPAAKAATTKAVKAEPVKKAATKAAPKAAGVKAPAAKAVATPKPKAAPKAAAKPKAEAKPKAAPAKKAAAAAVGVVALGAVMNEAGKPKIRGAGKGAPDDLNLIKGVGPKLNTLLIGLGVTRFAQIASWTKAEIAEVDGFLGNFTGRIVRDNWVDQADLLAKGDLKGFAKKYGEVGSEIKK